MVGTYPSTWVYGIAACGRYTTIQFEYLRHDGRVCQNMGYSSLIYEINMYVYIEMYYIMMYLIGFWTDGHIIDLCLPLLCKLF